MVTTLSEATWKCSQKDFVNVENRKKHSYRI